MPPPGGAPHGYLQLTDSTHDQSGAVLYNHPLPANEGLDITFDQWQYGSTTPNTPADGISFFLTDGDTDLNHPGAFGGSLGYAQKLPDDNPNAAFLPGVDRGYLGVGLDVLGNYFGDWEHRGNGCPNRSPAGTHFRVPAPGQNMVTVRGPGDGTQNYCFLTATTNNFTTNGPWTSTLPGTLQGPLTALPPQATPAQAETALEPSRRRVHVQLSPAPNPQLTVSVDFNDGRGFQQVLHTPAPQPVPQTYKFGFASSTGLFTDVHLIRNVVINTEEPLPQLNLVKQVRRPLPGDLVAGTRVPYDFVVTNSGNTNINNVAVNDPKIGPVTCPTTTLAPGETVTCTAIYTVTPADVAQGSINNTAIATGNANGQTVTSPPSSENVPIPRPPSLEVEKKADVPGPYSVGQTVPFSYTVRNTGGIELTGVRIHDDRVTGITCASTTLAPEGSPGDTTTCHGTYTITPADGTAGFVTNTARATGTANDQAVTSPPTDQTLEVGAPHITLNKQVISPGPFTVGSQVRYAYTVTNTGSTPLRDVLVSDDRAATVTCDAATLAPGASTTCHGTYTITQADVNACNPAMQPGGCSVTNTAQAAGTDPQGNQIASEPAQATVTVVRLPGLEVEKKAETPGPQLVGQTVTYTYTVRNTGGIELTGVRIHDDRVTGITCASTTLAPEGSPGDTTTCHGTYTITPADGTAGFVTNTARATGTANDQAVTSPPTDLTLPVGAPHITLNKQVSTPGPFTIGSQVPYAYTVTNTGNTELHNILINDDHVTDITCNSTTLAPGASTTCHGTFTITKADLKECEATMERGENKGCDITNTARATGTNPQGNQIVSEPAQATITVSKEKKPPEKPEKPSSQDIEQSVTQSNNTGPTNVSGNGNNLANNQNNQTSQSATTNAFRQ